MKQFYCVILLLLCASAVNAQQCCTMPAAAMELSMYTSHDFLLAHEAPLPFAFVAERGSFISFPAPDGKTARAFLVPSSKKSNRYLFVFHEWWGLNGYIQQEAERWQHELGDVNVIALDLYDGQVATTPEQAQKLSSTTKPDRVMSIIHGAISYVGPDAKIETLGWCYGGGWALQASIVAAKQGIGTVMYYGMPEFETAKLQQLQGPVVEFFGMQDQFINKDLEKKFKSAMGEAHRHLETHEYNAVHAFANPSNPKYDKAAAGDANARALAFLKALK